MTHHPLYICTADRECSPNCTNGIYILKIQLTKNHLYKDGCHPAMPKYALRIGAYCKSCDKFYKWLKQDDELIQKIKGSMLCK